MRKDLGVYVAACLLAAGSLGAANGPLGERQGLALKLQGLKETWSAGEPVLIVAELENQSVETQQVEPLVFGATLELGVERNRERVGGPSFVSEPGLPYVLRLAPGERLTQLISLATEYAMVHEGEYVVVGRYVWFHDQGENPRVTSAPVTLVVGPPVPGEEEILERIVYKGQRVDGVSATEISGEKPESWLVKYYALLVALDGVRHSPKEALPTLQRALEAGTPVEMMPLAAVAAADASARLGACGAAARYAEQAERAIGPASTPVARYLLGQLRTARLKLEEARGKGLCATMRKD